LAAFYKGRVRAEQWSRKMLRRIRYARKHRIYVQHKDVVAMWRDVLQLGGPFVHSKLRRYVKLMGLAKALRKETVKKVNSFVAVICCRSTIYTQQISGTFPVRLPHRK